MFALSFKIREKKERV